MKINLSNYIDITEAPETREMTVRVYRLPPIPEENGLVVSPKYPVKGSRRPGPDTTRTGNGKGEGRHGARRQTNQD